MVQEQTVEIPKVEDAPVAPKEPEGLAPEAEPAPEPTAETEPVAEGTETEEPTAPTFDASRYEHDEKFTSFLEDTKVEARREGQKRERGRRAEVEALHQQNRQVVMGLNQAVEGLFQRLNYAIDNGTIDNESVARTLQQYAPHLGHFAQWNDSLAQQLRSVGGQESIVKFLTRTAEETTGKADWATKFTDQLKEDWLYDGGEEAFQDFVKDLKKRVAAPLEKRIATLEAQLEKGKVQSRSTGPDQVRKDGGGARSYSEMSPEERNKLSPQERDRLVKQEMGWQ